MIADVLREIAAELQAEAAISDRPGQMGRLEALSERLGNLAARTEDDILLACEWSDYRKETVSSANADAAHHAFKAGWAAACGDTFEPGPLR